MTKENYITGKEALQAIFDGKTLVDKSGLLMRDHDGYEFGEDFDFDDETQPMYLAYEEEHGFIIRSEDGEWDTAHVDANTIQEHNWLMLDK